MASRIEISHIEFSLNIGCDTPERSTAQVVSACVKITNYQKFKASKTDKIEDTIDVSSVKRIVRQTGQDKELHTLERLGQLLEEALRENFLQTGLCWELTLTKKNFSWTYVQTWST